MSETREPDERSFADWFRRVYERTPLPGPEARNRIDTSVRAGSGRRHAWFSLEPWFEPHTFTLRPIAGVAVAIALVAVGAVLAHRFEGRTERSPMSNAPVAQAPSTHAVRFVFVDAKASHVELVGDFNGWDASATPMRRRPGDGAWTIAVSLASGWHSYAFVVDGAEWVQDPTAPLAPADDFGTPRSVVVVGEHGI